MGFALDAFKFIGSNLARGALSKLGSFGMGSLLGFIGTPAHDYTKDMVQELKQINQKLDQVHYDLQNVETELKGIEEILSQILTEEIYRAWGIKAASLDAAYSHIDTDYKNYQIYTTPTEAGILPHVSKKSLDSLAQSSYLDPDYNDDYAITDIHLAITGSTAEDGILTLLVKYIIAKIKSNHEEWTCSTLDDNIADISNYYFKMLARQLKAINLVIEAHRYQKDGHAVTEGLWNDYLEKIKIQENYFFESIWMLIEAFIENIYNKFDYPDLVGDLIESEAPKLTGNCIMDFMSLNHYNSDQSKSFYESMYPDLIKSPEQTYLSDAEELMGAFYLYERSDNKTPRRIVIHALGYGLPLSCEVDTSLTKELSKQFTDAAIPITKDGGKIDIQDKHVDCYNYDQQYISMCRYVYEVNEDGTYKMKNVNDIAPKVLAYDEPDTYYRFQSDYDLELSATVSDDNRVGIIRFVPYAQQA